MRKFLIFALMLSLLFPSCENKRERSFTELSLNTICSISVYTSEDEDLVPGAFTLMEDLSSMIDMYNSDSEIAYVNRHAYEEEVLLSEELFNLISYAYEVTEHTQGAFNIAIGPLVKLWGIGSDDAKKPSEEEIAQVLPLLNWHNIVLNAQNRSIRFLKEGMMIDLSGLGKGYISDRLASYFKENGCESALINLGGNVYAIGMHPEGRAWSIGIQSPGDDRGGYYTSVECSDEAVVTSGGYERYFKDEEGKIYHHILDSFTGYPSSSDIVSSTIITSDGTLADMLSTACFVMGSERAVEVVEYYGVKAVFLTDSGEIIRVGI